MKRFASFFFVVVLFGFACSRREPPSLVAIGRLAASAQGASSAVPVTDEEERADNAGISDTMANAGPTTTDLPTGPEYEVVAGGEAKLAATATFTWVYAGPNDETAKLGYLRAGAVVDRSEKPVAHTKRCKQGWYRVVPRGFVCAGRRATLDVNDPIVVASWKRPARGEPLPYRYGRSKETPPYFYFRMPTEREQERAEGIKHSEYRNGNPKERLLPLVGEVDPIPIFLANGQALPKPFGATQRLRVSSHEGKASTQSGFAFLSVHDIEGRLFGLSTDLNLIPLDRVNLARLTPMHGGEIPGLPAALITNALNAPRYQLDSHGVPQHDGQYEKYSALGLAGEPRGDLWQTVDGAWVSIQGAKLIKKREEFPSFAKEGSKKWIDVSIHQQLLVAYEGQRAVYVAQISTGVGEMGDPETTRATKRGVFTIKSKHITATMTGEESVDDYELADVPYVQYFEAGYAIHGAFWHEHFGQPWSHGCINLPPRDAAWLFEWTEPQVPKEWHGVQANGDGTIIYVHYL